MDNSTSLDFLQLQANQVQVQFQAQVSVHDPFAMSLFVLYVRFFA